MKPLLTVHTALTLLAGSLLAQAVAAANAAPLPRPAEWAGPANAPGDKFEADFTGTPAPGSPAIAEWTRTAKPDESFVMTGVRFTARANKLAGTDTTVWLWADTPQGGTLRQAHIWKVTPLMIVATVPADVPFGLYLVWVENEAGTSAPVCLNRTQPLWLGPLGPHAAPGGVQRVFGKNLSHHHGTKEAFVYLRAGDRGRSARVSDPAEMPSRSARVSDPAEMPDRQVSHASWRPSVGVRGSVARPATAPQPTRADSGEWLPLPVTRVEPYAVEFVVPAQLAEGRYQILTHNGHGGRFGWGEPLELIVEKPWQRGPDEVALRPTGADDTAALQGAIDTLHAQPQGGTVRIGPARSSSPANSTSKAACVCSARAGTRRRCCCGRRRRCIISWT